MAKAKTSITTENRSGSAADAAAKEKRTEMPLSDLHPFEGHPFKVLDDELMEQTVESIKQIGVVSPLIVRPDPEGGFEILRDTAGFMQRSWQVWRQCRSSSRKWTMMQQSSLWWTATCSGKISFPARERFPTR